MKAHNREHIHLPEHLGDEIADKVTEALGSWDFILIQSFVLMLWIVLNSVRWFWHFDPAPFILLNLCLSFQAAFTGPIVLLSQNRQAEKDRKRDDLEAQEVEQLFSSHQLLLQINQQQLEILQLLRDGKETGRQQGLTYDTAPISMDLQLPSLAEYLSQCPEHPLARETGAWIASLGKTLADVVWWMIDVKKIFPHRYKARVCIKFAKSEMEYEHYFEYSELEFLKGQ